MTEKRSLPIDKIIRKIKQEFPIKGAPERIKPRLMKIMNELVYLRPALKKFRTGRTNKPDTRKRYQFNRKPADELLELYYTKSQKNANIIETFLNTEYWSHRKNFNIKKDSRGRTSQDKTHYVYVSIKKRFLIELGYFLFRNNE